MMAAHRIVSTRCLFQNGTTPHRQPTPSLAMIRLIQNAQTTRKGTLNFMDQNGKVVGFNPRPDGNPLAFFVYDINGNEVDTDGLFIENYLDGLPYQFGNDGRIVKHDRASDEDDRLIISILPDVGSGRPPLSLHIVCMNSLYYTADFVLSDEDRLFFQSKPPKHDRSAQEIIASIEKSLLKARQQLAKAAEELERLRGRENAPVPTPPTTTP